MAYQFKQAVLSNGLTIVAEVDPDAHSAAAGFFVKTGARDETTDVMGVSHFLEHMMFKGTARRTTDQINQGFDRIGAKNNAYTSSEMTCFHATVLPDRLLGPDNALDILSDMMRPSLRKDDFDTEKNVILEEIAMYQDNPFWVLYERTMEVHCGAPSIPGDDIAGMHPLGHRVLGTNPSITALTSEQMRAYFQQRYSADNTVLSLAGRVDFDASVEQVARACGSWQRTGAGRDARPPNASDRLLDIRDPKVNRAYQLMLTPAPAANDDRRYAAGLLAHILGGPDNSRFHWALIETGLAEEAEAAYDGRDGVGDFMIFVVADRDKADRVWSIVEREVDALKGSLTEADLERIRCKMVTSVTLAGERPGGRMQRLGRQWMTLGRYSTLDEELARLNAVRVDDVRSLLDQFPLRPRTIGRMLPA
ncbi:MAG: insulinase family protein [Phycisphaeraceae bacterium]|nr:insulinase family protein [Phycisphaeraceae bacterium]